MVTWVRRFAERLFSGQQKILSQIKHWNLKEYFVYFEDFNVQSWVKRFVVPGKRISRSAAITL